ncbi:hypothetical protein EfsSVR2332_04180 [Enterococcus faecalis]|uniref:Uncharacterized protein n=1 Tax=Enterococcus faecalis TaxID=1351 RepID=A0AC59HL26_ENTFL|nr:hypothetical protein EfsSVR2085_03850 [Enterococcus faecalis]BDQ48676.1 hypothetical protein EfsSVR2281_04870 [Enterococcus faecalis]BDQ59329.1 hypothetical protein EfsSVR2331_34540 [Enterococcus faecalis]BDQ60340.1 hypothetical protein EfsSVR2332_04180 [Enterococcus faecalis]
MKSLILKDLYNIGHNTKSMLFILAVFAVAFMVVLKKMCKPPLSDEIK